ncbi:hypothetical protein WR25_01372 [Diploscapter pachys]|uniref:Helicase ATP-binding domain-containing protein n=1 Tax=Diploscapter pachys TaxID=2018661 RepID=A0A2A2KVC6_9BILA|nr:hypothetical protein WR25_01372 [Diploscapter pachys]
MNCRTNFDAMAEKDDFFMEAQKLEMERLERLKKNRPSNDDHLQQFSALLSPHVQGPLPLLDVDAQDFDLEDVDGKPQSSFDIGKVKKQEMDEDEEEEEGEEQMNIGSMPVVKKEEAAEPEIIDLSSDDDDIQEIGSFQRRPVYRTNVHAQSTSSLPSLSNASYRSYGGRRTRWVGTEKEREDMLQIEKQHNQERERLRKQKRRTEDIEDIKCTTEGRLLVNSGHPEGESDIFVASHLTNILQPHQLGGVRFLWDNIITSLDEFKISPGFGAILAHSMGLGKSIQVITFVEIFLRVTQAKKVLLIVPINVIQNWMAEFEKWLPIISSSGERLRQFQIFLIGDTVKTFDQRIDMIQTWAEKGGVLLIGYDMFRLLIRATQPKKPKPQRPRLRFMNGQSINKNTAQAQQQTSTATSSSDAQHTRQEKQDEPDKEKEEDLRLEDGPDDGYTANGRVRKEANDIIRQNLLDPGPDLVVCDEGHKIKNLNSDISMALSSIKTRRRIVLTGYPLQNNLMEYYVMIDFVRPKYLGEKKSFSLMFEKPIKNGQCVDSTPSDIKLARQRTHILIEKLKGFVQRRTHNLLKKILPLNKEFVVLLRKSPVQKELYKKFLIYAGDELTQGNATFNPLKAFAACTKIWNHPDILAKTLQKRREENDRGRRYDSDSNSTSMHGSEQSGCDAGAVTSQAMQSGSLHNNLFNHSHSMLPPTQNYSSTMPQNNFGYSPAQFPNNSYMNPPNIQQQQQQQPNNYPPSCNPFINSNTQFSNYYNQSSMMNPPSLNQINHQQQFMMPYSPMTASPQMMLPPQNAHIQQQQMHHSHSFPQMGHSMGFVPQTTQQQQMPLYPQNTQPQQSFYPSPSPNQMTYSNSPSTSQSHILPSMQQQQQLQSNIPIKSCASDDLWDGIPDLDEFSHKSGGFQRDQGGTGRDNDDEATPMKQPGKRGKRGKTGRKAKTENGQSRRTHNTAPNDEDEMSDDEELDKGLRYDWAEDVMTNYVKGRSENGYKLVLTMEIIDQSTIRGEKILVFRQDRHQDQNLTALDLMEEYLDKRRVQTADGDGEPWFRGRNYFRFDGSTSGSERERLINQFNSNPSLRLFLISTRAGSLGINLVSASRCVIFDACWNPVHDAQAVCRIYRYGQQKKTYIYRLILDNCMERAIFNRQISKHGLQQRVVDEAQVDTNITQKELEALLIYDDQLDQDDSRHDVENWDVEDGVLQAAVVKCNHMLTGMPFLHESLMMEREEGLSEEEKKEAELWFDLEQRKLSEGPELYDSLTIGNSDFKGGSSNSSSSTLGNVALNQFRQSSTLNGVSSWVMNARANPAMPSGLPPARSTPMPNVLQRNTTRNYMVNGGGATMQSAKSSLSGGIGRMNMSQIAPQILNAPLCLQKPFPGASKASAIHHISNGTMQKIKLDRALLLPNANRSGRMVNVPVGAEVVLVKMNADIYISFLSPNGPELLDARGSVFDANTANCESSTLHPPIPIPIIPCLVPARLPPIIPPTRMARGFHSALQSSMPSTSRLHNQTMPVQPFAPQIVTSNSEPDVIELD